MDGNQTQSRLSQGTEEVYKNYNVIQQSQIPSSSNSPKLLHKTKSTRNSLDMQKLSNLSSTSSTSFNHQQEHSSNPISSVARSSTHSSHKSDTLDNCNSTGIQIKILDNSKPKGLNRNYVNNDDLANNDDVTTPFTNNGDLNVNENDAKTSAKKSRSKSFFRNIFCCFTSSNNHSKSPVSKTNSSNNLKTSVLSESYIKSNKSNNLNNTCSSNNSNLTNDKPNLNNVNHITNLNSLSINTNNSNENKNIIANLQNKNSYQNSTKNDKPNNKSSFIDNNNNIANGANYGQVQYNNCYNNDSTNNNVYSSTNYFTSANDNINLNHVEKPLLGPIQPSDNGKKCLIIDLDETLVHSSFKQVSNADFIVPVEIDGIVHQVYVLKRPHVDEFLRQMGKLYECILFTASLAKYADPVADLLDKYSVFRGRLFREACVYYRGNYVKDLSRLGRDLNKVIIIDNSPASYIFHPDNAVPCTSWFDDSHDTELLDLIPYFEKLATCDSVYSVLKQQSNTSSMQNSLNHQMAHGGNYQPQSTIYAQQQQSYDENQQVPSSQLQSLIYQQQQGQQISSQNNENTTNYSLNENKILLSIDLMMAKKQQQLQ